MSKLKIIISVLLFIIISTIVFVYVRKIDPFNRISISYPFNNALFPPEFPAPTFEWRSEYQDSLIWDVTLITRNNSYSINASTQQTKWTPEESKWDSIKYLSNFDRVYFFVKKSGDKRPSDKVFFKISRDSVGAPVLYRQMPIPSFIAEENLDSMNYMLINFGSKRQPHIAMEGFDVCGNCHSFTEDGRTIGLDLDAGSRDKGGYFISEIKDTIVFNPDNYRSWSKMDNRSTFGLFSKISPDGRYIVTTVKDRAVFVNFTEEKDMAYSQLFFPVNGHLAIFDRQTNILKELPGANLDEYVQSNAIWTPDGKNIIFSRANALPPYNSKLFGNVVKNKNTVDQFVERKKTYKYDLCVIPFNNGDGGTAKPIIGASNNGKSNYFPAVSPDGKWLIYCRAEDFMLLRPDSRLYVIPLMGGKARELDCNLSSMNSWHAWSPNSKWMVFASKGLSPYTDMFLTHIDEKANASIPVLVDKARAHHRVINYPEFVNRRPEDTYVMKYDYVELVHIGRALSNKDIEKAKQLFYKLETQQSYFLREDYSLLSDYLYRMGLHEESKKYSDLVRQMRRSNKTNK